MSNSEDKKLAVAKHNKVFDDWKEQKAKQDARQAEEIAKVDEAIEYFKDIDNQGPVIHAPYVETAINALEVFKTMGGDCTAHRAAMTQALGWLYVDFCTMLDHDVDPRTQNMDELLARFEKHFRFDDDTILVPT